MKVKDVVGKGYESKEVWYGMVGRLRGVGDKGYGGRCMIVSPGSQASMVCISRRAYSTLTYNRAQGRDNSDNRGYQ